MLQGNKLKFTNFAILNAYTTVISKIIFFITTCAGIQTIDFFISVCN